MEELILINRILGHANHLKNNVMYLLLTKYVTTKISNLQYSKYLMYDTFGKKKNGLVQYKNRLGFQPYTVNYLK
jgi:hypothetical protein